MVLQLVYKPSVVCQRSVVETSNKSELDFSEGVPQTEKPVASGARTEGEGLVNDGDGGCLAGSHMPHEAHATWGQRGYATNNNPALDTLNMRSRRIYKASRKRVLQAQPHNFFAYLCCSWDRAKYCIPPATHAAYRECYSSQQDACIVRTCSLCQSIACQVFSVLAHLALLPSNAGITLKEASCNLEAYHMSTAPSLHMKH